MQMSSARSAQSLAGCSVPSSPLPSAHRDGKVLSHSDCAHLVTYRAHLATASLALPFISWSSKQRVKKNGPVFLSTMAAFMCIGQVRFITYEFKGARARSTGSLLHKWCCYKTKMSPYWVHLSCVCWVQSVEVKRGRCPTSELLIWCVVCLFVCFPLSLFFFLSGLSHQDNSSIPLSFPNTIAKDVSVVYPPGVLSLSHHLNNSSTIPGRPRLLPQTDWLLLLTSGTSCCCCCWDVWPLILLLLLLLLFALILFLSTSFFPSLPLSSHSFVSRLIDLVSLLESVAFRNVMILFLLEISHSGGPICNFHVYVLCAYLLNMEKISSANRWTGFVLWLKGKVLKGLGKWKCSIDLPLQPVRISIRAEV